MYILQNCTIEFDELYTSLQVPIEEKYILLVFAISKNEIKKNRKQKDAKRRRKLTLKSVYVLFCMVVQRDVTHLERSLSNFDAY